VDAQGKAAFNTPEGKAAFQYWVDLYKKWALATGSYDPRSSSCYRAVSIWADSVASFWFRVSEYDQQNAPAIAQVSATALR